jgi:hypothetical protein
MKTVVRAVAIAVVSTPLVGAAQQIERPPNVTLTIHVLNRAGVSSGHVLIAETVATHIYAGAGVRVSWIDDERRRSQERAPLTAGAFEPRIILLRGASERDLIDEGHIGAGVLGVAPTDGAGTGDIAYVLVDRLTSTLAGREFPLPWLLGQVIAHEVGHLLLPVGGHTNKGIMRAGMEPRMGARPAFTEAQAALIRRRLETR